MIVLVGGVGSSSKADTRFYSPENKTLNTRYPTTKRSETMNDKIKLTLPQTIHWSFPVFFFLFFFFCSWGAANWKQFRWSSNQVSTSTGMEEEEEEKCTPSQDLMGLAFREVAWIARCRWLLPQNSLACFSALPSDRNDFAITIFNSTHLCLLFAVIKEAIDRLSPPPLRTSTARKCTFRKNDRI